MRSSEQKKVKLIDFHIFFHKIPSHYSYFHVCCICVVYYCSKLVQIN